MNEIFLFQAVLFCAIKWLEDDSDKKTEKKYRFFLEQNITPSKIKNLKMISHSGAVYVKYPSRFRNLEGGGFTTKG